MFKSSTGLAHLMNKKMLWQFWWQITANIGFCAVANAKWFHITVNCLQKFTVWVLTSLNTIDTSPFVIWLVPFMYPRCSRLPTCSLVCSVPRAVSSVILLQYFHDLILYVINFVTDYFYESPAFYSLKIFKRGVSGHLQNLNQDCLKIDEFYMVTSVRDILKPDTIDITCWKLQTLLLIS